MTALLGGLTPEQFLRDYWQKQPLLIRQGLPEYHCPITADELAGLACEEAVESRIVLESDQGRPWQLRHGPFDEDVFAQLPSGPWSLLVQGLDHWVPEISDLLDLFRFIPNWRIDDIMASFAPAGGSVGPHFDYYDVFLIQARGQRRWQVGGRCDRHSPRLDGTPLRILREFSAEHEWVLQPGDILYLPPQIAHWGVALDDCMTLSVGFRSASHEEVLTSYADYVASELPLEQRLDDPDLQPRDNPGRIDDTAIHRVERFLRDTLLDSERLVSWFGQYSTEPKHEGIVEAPEEEWQDRDIAAFLTAGTPVRWNEGSRFAFHEQADRTLLFVDGERFILRGGARPLAPLLCAGSRPDPKALANLTGDPALLSLVTRLFNQGSLYCEDRQATDRD